MIEIESSPTIKSGTKYLEDVTVGSISIPSKTAYGTIEADIYKSDTGIILLYPIKGNQSDFNLTDGYYLQFGNTESLQLGRANSTVLFVTSGAYITANTWYKVRITRSNDGIFTVLMKGGTLAATAGYDGWHLVVPTTGTNPVTDTGVTASNYLVFRTTTAAGNRITNIKITEGVAQ